MNGVRVVVDFASPASWLAVEGTRALEQRTAQRFEWAPLRAPAFFRRPFRKPDEDRAARHSRLRNEYLAADLRRYAEARGLDLGDPWRDVDVLPASHGLLWLRRRDPARVSAFVARAFDRIWRENAAADRDFVESVLAGEAAGYRAYADGEGASDLASLESELQSQNVWTTPAYLVADELFIGRQHLPMVEWLLKDRSGPPPI